MRDEELTDEQIKKMRKTLLDPQNIMLLAMVALIVMSLFVGNRLGYRQGYTYVKTWYVDYIDNQCTCSEMVRRTRLISNGTIDWGLKVNVSET